MLDLDLQFHHWIFEDGQPSEHRTVPCQAWILTRHRLPWSMALLNMATRVPEVSRAGSPGLEFSETDHQLARQLVADMRHWASEMTDSKHAREGLVLGDRRDIVLHIDWHARSWDAEWCQEKEDMHGSATACARARDISVMWSNTFGEGGPQLLVTAVERGAECALNLYLSRRFNIGTASLSRTRAYLHSDSFSQKGDKICTLFVVLRDSSTHFAERYLLG